MHDYQDLIQALDDGWHLCKGRWDDAPVELHGLDGRRSIEARRIDGKLEITIAVTRYSCGSLHLDEVSFEIPLSALETLLRRTE